ncbi:Rrf2 family transcriptional regulator [Bosea sp. 2KB_26]|uniref:RrF2 family transcriptional regulator n=1 Tax=Bosea sp. 2KB_26 TaxID=3237475 RepID=UPI000DE460C5
MLSRKAKYGLKALAYLALSDNAVLQQPGTIAAARNIPRKFLEGILVELRNAGFVASHKGRAGGYRLARPAAEIRLGSVIRHLDGALAPIPCASRSRYEPCPDCDEPKCEVRRVMIEVRQAICDVLDHRSLADLSAQLELGLLVDIPCAD